MGFGGSAQLAQGPMLPWKEGVPLGRGVPSGSQAGGWSGGQGASQRSWGFLLPPEVRRNASHVCRWHPGETSLTSHSMLRWGPGHGLSPCLWKPWVGERGLPGPGLVVSLSLENWGEDSHAEFPSQSEGTAPPLGGSLQAT